MKDPQPSWNVSEKKKKKHKWGTCSDKKKNYGTTWILKIFHYTFLLYKSHQILLGTAFKLHKFLSSAAFWGHHSSLRGKRTPRWRQDPHEGSSGLAVPDPHLLYLVPKSSCSALPRQIIAEFPSPHAGKSSCVQHAPLSPRGMENWHFYALSTW